LLVVAGVVVVVVVVVANHTVEKTLEKATVIVVVVVVVASPFLLPLLPLSLLFANLLFSLLSVHQYELYSHAYLYRVRMLGYVVFGYIIYVVSYFAIDTINQALRPSFSVCIRSTAAARMRMTHLRS